MWEKEYGEIPKNYVLIFLDNNKLNCVLSNLILISRRELSILKSRKLLNDRKENNIIAINLAKLLLVIKDKENELNKEEKVNR